MRDQLHSGSGSEEDRADKVAMEQDRPSQRVFIVDGLGQDDATIGDHRKGRGTGSNFSGEGFAVLE